MLTLFQFALILIIFFPVNYGAYWLTEVKGLPEWLQYRPWTCRLCLCFWSLIGIYTAIWVSFACYIAGIGGIMLAILNALAMYIHQRNNTIKI